MRAIAPKGQLNGQQSQELIKKMTNQLIYEIGQQIQNEEICINQHTANVDSILDKTNKLDNKYRKSPTKPKLDIESLSQMKNSKLVQLKELQRYEQILKKSTFLTSSNVSKTFSKLQRSQFTEQEMQKIKQILKKQKIFANQLRKKERQLLEWAQEKQREEEELRQRQLHQKCQQRKSKLLHQRQQLERRRLQRKKNYEDQINKLKELKQKKLLHQIMEEKFSKQLQNQVRQQLKLYELQKQRKHKVVLKIDEHQKTYLQMKKQKQNEREKLKEQSLSKSKTILPSINSHFWKKIREQQKEESRIKEWKQNQIENNLQKKKIYSQQVKELFLPNIKTNRRTLVEQMQQQRTLPLNLYEQHALGNDYMKTIHSNITGAQKQKLKKSLEKPQQTGGNSALYKNYLSQLKLKNKRQKYSDLTSKAFEQALTNQNIPYEKKVQRAKKMLQLKQKKPERYTDKQLVDSIKSKLIVLKELAR